MMAYGNTTQRGQNASVCPVADWGALLTPDEGPRREQYKKIWEAERKKDAGRDIQADFENELEENKR